MAAKAEWESNMKEIFTGKLVRLDGVDPEEVSKAFSRWSRDSEYTRLLNMFTRPLSSAKATQKWLEEGSNEEPHNDFFFFTIRTLDDNKLIGGMGLEIVDWAARDSFVFIFVGERENWGKGYGSDAMRLLLQFAFLELNLRRVSLGVFEYNPRAIRSYEKIGFCHEGRLRSYLKHEGQRWDLLMMGILREEWLGFNTTR
jgi:RimJ/RimL family protein N-acetyltransferase